MAKEEVWLTLTIVVIMSFKQQVYSFSSKTHKRWAESNLEKHSEYQVSQYYFSWINSMKMQSGVGNASHMTCNDP